MDLTAHCYENYQNDKYNTQKEHWYLTIGMVTHRHCVETATILSFTQAECY